MTLKKVGGELAHLVRVSTLHDTSGAPIAPGLPIAYTHRADGQPSTATITDGVHTWVFTWSYDAGGLLERESGWVRS